MNNRAQILSIDLVIAIGLAMLVWGILALNIAESKTQLAEQSARGERIIRATQTLDILLKTPGSPTGWENASSINAYGLAIQPYVLSVEKTSAFFAENIETLKEAFNLPPLNAEFSLVEINGTLIDSVGDIENETKRGKIVFQRPVIHNETTKLFKLTLQ